MRKGTLILCWSCREAILMCVRDLAVGEPIRAEHFHSVGGGGGPENGDRMKCPECGLAFCDFTLPVVLGPESVSYTKFGFVAAAFAP